MKLFSIFAPRPRREDVAAPERPVDLALRVAGIFGVPESHLSPQVRTAFNVMIGEIDSLRLDVEQLKLSLAEAEASADHDALAPVYNRRAFMREASKIVAFVKRHEVEASMIYFDLNNFKSINDTHGHLAGDLVIRAAVDLVVATCRTVDIVGRYGGEELVLCLPSTGGAAAVEVAERIRQGLAAHRVPFDLGFIAVSTSCGVAAWHAPDESLQSMLHRADQALYRAKAAGRNRTLLAD